MPIANSRSLLAAFSAAFVSAPPLAAQCELELTGGNLPTFARFGAALDTGGALLLVGAPGDDGFAAASGAAYLFAETGSDWSLLTKLAAGDGALQDRFGSSAAVGQMAALVGAPADEDAGPFSGSAYVFEPAPATGWQERGKLTASDAAAGDLFGSSLSLAGRTAVVGSPRADGGAQRAGSVYVFERDAQGWSERAKLVASDASMDAHFGSAVSVGGDRILVGAPGRADGGAVYVFDRTGSGWQQTAILRGGDTAAGDRLGESVALAGPWALIGAPSDDAAGSFSGSAYLFERTSAVWSERQKLIGSGTHAGSQFGGAVALSSTHALIGASNEDVPPLTRLGAAYLFAAADPGWQERARVTVSLDTSTYLDVFAAAVALEGDRLVVGDPVLGGSAPGGGGSNEAGSAFVFDASDLACLNAFESRCFCDAGAPCGNLDSHAGCRNSSAFGAYLGATGTSAVSADDLVLVASGVPAQQSGLVYMGGAPVQLPFGDGQRCVGRGGAGLFRFPLQSSGAEGRLIAGPGLVAHSLTQFAAQGHITAGSTWHFQAWFRDPAGPCGNGFNLSNAMAVGFVP